MAASEEQERLASSNAAATTAAAAAGPDAVTPKFPPTPAPAPAPAQAPAPAPALTSDDSSSSAVSSPGSTGPTDPTDPTSPTSPTDPTSPTGHITEVPSEFIVAESAVSAQTTDTDETDAASVFSDSDSALGSVSTSSLVSLTDSIREFRHENGRTYHSLSAGKYWCPNDDPENSRLDIQHHAHRLTFDGALCCCPKRDGARRVLDLGTGTGIWAMEYADDHPEAEVVGVDLSPIQPEFVPPNCQFEVDDVEKEWTWQEPFDFIWWRALLGCFADAKTMVQKCYDNLAPGGYLEMHDGTFPPECDDGSMPRDCALMRLATLATEASARLGRPIDVSPHYAKMMQEAGFVDIVFKKYKWPTNSWPRDRKMKTLGMWTLANVEPGLEGLFLALLTRGMGMSLEETMLLCAEARKDLRNTDIHAYWPAYYCYGRKP